ncbi:MAG TPA: DNA polymerase [Prolixibacteraceae bacterium]|nr:DNA polymerase [Prolixibacteraceae bacterium]
MKKYIVTYIALEWFSLNIDDYGDFKKSNVFNSKNIIITFQTSDLIRELNSKGRKLLPAIIDLECFDKQMSQEGKEFREYANWKALNFLRHYKIIDSEFKLNKDNVKQFLEYLASLYKSLLLKDESEFNRFNDIEIDINRIIHLRQIQGVRVNLDIANKRCVDLEKTIYALKNILQLHHNIFTPDDIETQKDYLIKNKFNIIQSLLYSFKIRRKSDEVCNLFYELIRNQQDLDSLLYILSHWGGNERTFPAYLGFGTITSRIILRQPSLQNLRKSNRDIIIPDNGMKLFYVDYSQFEAGILASLSNDKTLIDLYNSDIYSDLAEKVLDNKDDRKEAKIIFYRYMYGDNSLKKEAQLYFHKFKKLVKFKSQIEKDISIDKKIGSAFGNFRYLFNDESNWALSHKVQSTASYIYKIALLRVYKEVKSAHFLIPMHDGTVYQINRIGYDDSKSKIEAIYKDVFRKLCPQIEPKLNCSEKFQ